METSENSVSTLTTSDKACEQRAPLKLIHVNGGDGVVDLFLASALCDARVDDCR